MSGRHEEILEGLLEYTRFPHGQGFAVIINGPWGSGKTEFIKRNLERLTHERSGEVVQKPIYVSLYGVSEIARIDDLLFEQMHPVLGNKYSRLAGSFLRGAARTALRIDIGQGMSLNASGSDVTISTILSKPNGRVVIFDDFERANLSPTIILAYINPSVEHEDCKVIILADETQIKESEIGDYQLRKEKTVGRTFQFAADVAGVYGEFLKKIDDLPARGFLADSEDTIRKIFADSGYENLRLLKQFMWDFERVWKVLTLEQRNSRIALSQYLELLCASALELRHGTPAKVFELLTRGSLRGRSAEPESDVDSKSAVSIRLKYPSVQFDAALFDAQTISDIILNSNISTQSIRAQFQQHPELRRPDDLPSWRALWLAFELPPANQDSAVVRFEADFETRRFSDRGEIYHIFGLCVWLSELGYPGWEADGLSDKLKAYVDDVYGEKLPTIEEVADDSSIDIRMGSNHLGYRCSDTAIYINIAEYERVRRTSWRKQGYPEVATFLHNLATRDGEEFMRTICFTAGGPATYASLGVLNWIPPQEFAATIAKATYSHQRYLLMALSIRYEQIHAYPELADEYNWLQRVYDSLRVESEKLPRIGCYYVKSLISLYLNKSLEHFATLRP